MNNFKELSDLTNYMTTVIGAFNFKIKAIQETLTDDQKIIYDQKIQEYRTGYRKLLLETGNSEQSEVMTVIDSILE